uniref:Coiled-coil domain containing 191 n=1 Tax=Cyclopterus lumpus TaxID=8103 RepID=A0A8C3AUF0_CYCLU
MTFPGHNHHLFRWRGLGKKKSVDKVHLVFGFRVEVASEFAVSEVFSHKKPRSGTNSRAVPLQSSDQLKDHDDAYSEAQALLSDWLSSKLRLELEVEEEDDLMCCNERRSRAALASAQPAALNYSNFDDLYNCLAEEEEQSAVNSFLQDLMEQEVLDFGVMEELALDVGQKRKKFRDPIVTMEARHLQVRENRARQEAERQRQQGEREARRDAREEAKRREREEETTKRQQARRQEDMVQQEMVTLRRRMEERRGLEQLVRQRERERVEGQRAARSLQSAPPPLTNQRPQDRERLYKEQKLQTMVHMVNLKRLQRHFSGWYSVVLDRRLRLGKAKALCDWKRQLRAWRAWRGVVWAEHQQREVVRAEEDFRAENRQRQLAVESDRRRLLRRCLNEWQLWCRIEKEQRELLAQQQETRRKMAALINAASTGKLMSSTLAPNASAVPQHKTPVGAVAQPTQPWQVTRRHAAPTAAKLHGAQQRGEGGGFICLKSAVSPASRFENRHAVQQQIITQQRKLLKEQQEKIAQLKEEQSVKSLELEMEKTTQLTQLSMLRASRPKSHKGELPEQREEEKQRQLKRQQELMKLARQHHRRNLLLRRGLAPWKRLIQIKQANIQVNHLSCPFSYWRMIQEERAKRFNRTRTLRRFLLALLDHVTQERLVEWDRQELAQEHNNRRVLRRCLLAWRQLPCLLRKERVKEQRREKLGQRVAEVLPDFGSYPL